MTDLNEEIVRRIKGINNRVRELEALDMVAIRIKTDTGRPTDTKLGIIWINTFDNVICMYADGGWRDLATW